MISDTGEYIFNCANVKGGRYTRRIAAGSLRRLLHLLTHTHMCFLVSLAHTLKTKAYHAYCAKCSLPIKLYGLNNFIKSVVSKRVTSSHMVSLSLLEKWSGAWEQLL